MLDNCGLSGTSIEGHAWSPMIIAGQNNKREVAVCDGDGMIKIFSQNDGKWTLVANLKGHDQAVTGIDWARSACGSIDRIISVSADRNGYVWSRSGGKLSKFYR